MEVNKTKEILDLNEVSGYNNAEKSKVQKDISKLDNDAFMRLFLEQLKNQDPTSPMETDKIITQTAQLTQVEMQEQAKQTMIEVADAMKSAQGTNEELKNLQVDMKKTLESLLETLGAESALNATNIAESPYNSVAMIGKIAETKINGVNLSEGKPMSVELFFDEAINAQSGTPKVMIYNENKELVREIDISARNGESGYISVEWDGRDDSGAELPSGAYSVLAHYNFKPSGEHNLARVGRGEVQSVLFDDGKAYLRLGELVVPLGDAVEFYAKGA